MEGYGESGNAVVNGTFTLQINLIFSVLIKPILDAAS
jgi:hypothetical protein